MCSDLAGQNLQCPKFSFLLAPLLLLMASVNSVFASVRYVDASSASPTPPYTTWATAARVIQDAVAAAAPGDEIVVTNGLYATGGRAVGTSLLVNRVAVDKPLTLRSVNGPQVTTIQGFKVSGSEDGLGDGAIRCVFLSDGASLSGFTLRNGGTKGANRSRGDEREMYGGGVWCESSNAVVINCTFTGNSADAGGGARGGTLSNCKLTDNFASWAGGGCYNSILSNCELTRNSTGWVGGGAYGGTLRNCTITENSSARYAGGVVYAALDHCTVTANSATSDHLLYPGVGGGVMGGSAHNCIVYFNRAQSGANYTEDTAFENTVFEYSCTTPLPPGVGNLDADPLLASPTHLSSSSPCIAAGNPAYALGADIDGELWATPPAMGADQPRSTSGPLSISVDAQYTNVAVGYIVGLRSQSVGPIRRMVWDFGDGTTLTNQPFASHAWSGAGAYTVRLSGFSDSFPAGITKKLVVTVSAGVQFVTPANPNPVFPYTSWEQAAITIQDAIAAAPQAGGLVLVTNGVYRSGTVSATGLNRVALTNQVTVRSVNGPAVTVIEGLTNGVRCAYIGDGSVLSGFTLTNGTAVGDGPPSWGGGVSCEPFGVVTNCVLTGNWAGHGGGAYGGALDHCTLAGNSAGVGGGAAGSLLDNCVIVGNSAVYSGGGVYGQFGARLNNCTVIGNSAARWGGGVVADWGSGECSLYNSIVYFNTAADWANYDEFTELNCCCTTPLPVRQPWQTSIVGNMTNAPLFVDPTAGNYRLRSDSPCINAGSDAYAPGPTDLDGRPRIANGTIDIGAYEFPAPTPGSWTRKADMPKALDGHAACAVDGILYAIGGHEIPGVYRQLATLYAYDPRTDSWTRKRDMPTPRRFPAAVVVDGIIYVLGGGGWFDPSLRTVEAYDPKTDTWTTKTPMLTDRFAHSACAVDGIIYTIGGIRGLSGSAEFLATVDAYNPATDQWTRKQSLPEPVWDAAANTVNGLIYVFFKKRTFVYDPTTARWTAKARIPSGSLNSYFVASSVVDGIVCLFGGASDDGRTTYKLSLAYDPARDSFTGKRNLPMACEAAASATIGGKIYHTGGASADPTIYPTAVYYADLWVFDPHGGMAAELLSLSRQSANTVRLAWQGEAGLRYGVQSRTNVAGGTWTRLMFSTGTNAVLATNAVVETTVTVPAADKQRFFQILEAN